jgi:hypothetical protein
MRSLIQARPQLVYSHTREGENIWHFAAQSGRADIVHEVGVAVAAVVNGQRKQERIISHMSHGFNQVSLRY